MPVAITVSEVRRAIYNEARRTEKPSTGSGNATALLGQFFHETFARIVQPDSPVHFAKLFSAANANLRDWQDALKDAVYKELVLPWLNRQHAVLHDIASESLLLWQAIDNLCDWLAEVIWAVRNVDGSLPDATQLVLAEQALHLEINEPDWGDTVVLTGIADALWKAPNGKGWCIAELKLGESQPAADLAQACLYHMMLARSDSHADGSMTLLGFRPKRNERFFEAAKLEPAKKELLTLIGQLAGVVGKSATDKAGAGSGWNVKPDILRPPPADVDETVRGKQLAKELLKVLAEYGAPAELAGEPVLGPTFHRVHVWQGRGIKVKRLMELTAEIESRLQLTSQPIISMAEGRIAFDLPRQSRRFIQFDEVASQLPRHPIFGNTQLIVGIDLAGRLVFSDLAEPENCHFLVAGTAGSGKSEWLRTAVLGLIATNTPTTLRLILVDPKRSAFNDLAGCPLLLQDIVFPDESPASNTFEKLVEEVDRRYVVMDGAPSLAEHYNRTGQLLPHIVCVCDEYFDLISTNKSERKAIELALGRLCSKARAAGVHLIIATQRPDRETVRGVLDTNLPARVGLKLMKAAEAKMICCDGCERLLGRGDLIFKSGGLQVRRLQGIYVPPSQAAEILQDAARQRSEILEEVGVS